MGAPLGPQTFAETSMLIQSLDSWVQPGIMGAQFDRLLAQCACCNLVMTRHIFSSHDCDWLLEVVCTIDMVRPHENESK